MCFWTSRAFWRFFLRHYSQVIPHVFPGFSRAFSVDGGHLVLFETGFPGTFFSWNKFIDLCVKTSSKKKQGHTTVSRPFSLHSSTFSFTD